MAGITLNPKKRGYLLPPGCKDLVHVLQGAPPKPSLGAKLCVNGQIKSKDVRVIDENGKQLGIVALSEAFDLARARSLDLVEIAPTAKPPICRLVDYGKWRFQNRKKCK